MARKKQKNSAAVNDWWSTIDDTVEGPRADMPTTKKLKASGRFYRIMLKALIPLTVFAMFAVIVMVGNMLSGEETDAYSGPPASQSTAMVAVNKWLDGVPSPLPGGRLVSWDSVRESPLPSGREGAEIAEDGIDSLEVHSLTVASPDGTQYKVQVQLAVGDDIGASVVGEPALGPVAPPADMSSASVSPWPTLPRGTASEEVNLAVKVWAEAFSSGDPARLLNAVGDARKGVSYVPLAGLTLNLDSINVTNVGAVFGESQNPEEDDDPERLVLQVVMEGAWSGADLNSSSSLPTFTYDLLVDKANTASPRVVAWGGAGTGVWLKPFDNAVVGKVVTANDLPDAEPTVAPSDSADTFEEAN